MEGRKSEENVKPPQINNNFQNEDRNKKERRNVFKSGFELRKTTRERRLFKLRGREKMQ